MANTKTHPHLWPDEGKYIRVYYKHPNIGSVEMWRDGYYRGIGQAHSETPISIFMEVTEQDPDGGVYPAEVGISFLHVQDILVLEPPKEGSQEA